MGKLLALSLLTTLAAAVLFQPVLMGKPRQLDENKSIASYFFAVVPLWCRARPALVGDALAGVARRRLRRPFAAPFLAGGLLRLRNRRAT